MLYRNTLIRGMGGGPKIWTLSNQVALIEVIVHILLCHLMLLLPEIDAAWLNFVKHTLPADMNTTTNAMGIKVLVDKYSDMNGPMERERRPNLRNLWIGGCAVLSWRASEYC